MIKLTNKMSIVPVFEKNAVPICFSANNSYIPQTIVMIRSIIAHAVNDKNYDFIILSADIDSVNEEYVVGLANNKQNISIRIFDISEMIEDVQFFTDSIYTPTTYSKEAYFRLFIPYTMQDYSKVIYFDGDMAAVKDVSPLIDIDMTNYIGAATRDYCGIAACYDPSSDRMEYRKEIGIKNQDDYFISSMVVLNIKKFKDMYSLDYVKQLISSRNWRQHDQDILNILCQDALLIVDAKWSFFEELEYAPKFLSTELKNEIYEAQKDPIVVHYAGSNKAWVDDKSPLTRYFWENVSDTPYFDLFYNKIDSWNIGYKCHVIKEMTNRRLDYYYDGNDVVLLSTPNYIGRLKDLKVCVETMWVKEYYVYINGYFEAFDYLGQMKLVARVNGIDFPCENATEYRRYGTTDGLKKLREFKACLPLDLSVENSMVDFYLTFEDGRLICPSYVSVDQFAPINEYGYSFYSSDDFIITKQTNRFEIAKHSRKKVLSLNRKICKYLRSKKEPYFTKMARVRWLYYLSKPIMKNKNIWLISGTDKSISGEMIEFYKYLKTKEDIIPYLVIGENDKETYELIQDCDTVVRARSKKHKYLFLHSKTVIANEYNLSFFMPTYVRSNEVRDMVANKKFVYWHDGTEDLTYNIKPWYNVHRFILSDQDTYDFMVNHNNGYFEKDLILANSSAGKRSFDDIFAGINEDYV